MAAGPVIIGCAPSSGSTLLRVLVGRHPSFAAGGELYVLDRPELFDVTAADLHDGLAGWMRAGLPRSFVGSGSIPLRRCTEYGWSPEELQATARSCGSWHELLRLFFGRFAARAGVPRWCEKTPSNVLGFHRAREAFPDAVLVHVLRDGRDVVASLMRRGHSPFLAASRWFVAVLAGLRHEEAGTAVRLRYEELVTAPEPALRGLFGTLGERFDPAVLEAGDGAGAAPAVRSWRLAEHGPVAAGAVGRRDPADEDVVLAHLAGVGLSEAGEAFLAGLPGDAAHERTALGLLQRLGYAHDAPAPRRLTRAERLAAKEEAKAFRLDQRRRYGLADPLVPTRTV